MGKRNDIFRKKYNKLDQLCRERYDLHRNNDGTRNNLSAIRKFADELVPALREKLLNIITIRNVVAHEEAAEVNEKTIQELDTFIAMAEQKRKGGGGKDFELLSYKTHNEKKMSAVISETYDDLDGEIPFNKRKKILEEAQKYIE